MKISFGIFFLIFTILSCVKNEKESVDIVSDKNYYPLSIGLYREYEVDSIIYRQGKLLDSVRLYIKEEITAKVKDTLGDIYILQRYHRRKLADAWTPITTFTNRIYDNKAVKNEGNIQIIPFVFPIIINQSWEGLAHQNTMQVFSVEGESVEIYNGWEPFKIKDKAKAEKIGNLNFDNVITVIQTDEEDFLNKRYSIEKYSRGIGLVYKEMAIIDCNSNINDCANNSLPLHKRSTKGYILRQSLIKHN